MFPFLLVGLVGAIWYGKNIAKCGVAKWFIYKNYIIVTHWLSDTSLVEIKWNSES